MVCAACVMVVLPLGVEKTQPPTETTSCTANPAMLSVVKFVKVVAAVVCTVILTGTIMWAEEAVGARGIVKTGRVLRVKLNWPALIAATEPVIWLGSRVMLLVVKVVSAGSCQRVPMPDPLVVVTDPWTTTD